MKSKNLLPSPRPVSLFTYFGFLNNVCAEAGGGGCRCLSAVGESMCWFILTTRNRNFIEFPWNRRWITVPCPHHAPLMDFGEGEHIFTVSKSVKY